MVVVPIRLYICNLDDILLRAQSFGLMSIFCNFLNRVILQDIKVSHGLYFFDNYYFLLMGFLEYKRSAYIYIIILNSQDFNNIYLKKKLLNIMEKSIINAILQVEFESNNTFIYINPLGPRSITPNAYLYWALGAGGSSRGLSSPISLS